MPYRITIPDPSLPQESRQLAETIADLHYTMGTIVEGAKELIPGESVEELVIGWKPSEESMRELVENLIVLAGHPPPAQPSLSPQILIDAQLTSAVGK